MPTFISLLSQWRRPALPAAGLQQFLFVELADVNALHGLTQLPGGFEHRLGVVEMGGGLDDGLGALFRIARLEDARADKNSLGTEMTDKRCIRRRRNAASGEIRDG